MRNHTGEKPYKLDVNNVIKRFQQQAILGIIWWYTEDNTLIHTNTAKTARIEYRKRAENIQISWLFESCDTVIGTGWSARHHIADKPFACKLCDLRLANEHYIKKHSVLIQERNSMDTLYVILSLPQPVIWNNTFTLILERNKMHALYVILGLPKSIDWKNTC